MRIGDVVSLSSATTSAVFEPFGNAWFHNNEAAQVSCDFGSVLEYFEHLPPIPRSCLAPLAKYATGYCSTFLKIEDVTSYTATVTPEVTEVALELLTAQATITVYETVPTQAIASILQFETETITSTRTSTYTILPPSTTINKVVTITADPVTVTMSGRRQGDSDSDSDADLDRARALHIDSPLGKFIHRRQHRVRGETDVPSASERFNSPPPPPAPAPARPSPNHEGSSNLDTSNNIDPPPKQAGKPSTPPTCKSIARGIFTLSHPPAVLSQACACLQIIPHTISTDYHPPKSALGSQFAPIKVTATRTSTVTQLVSLVSTVLDVRVQSVTRKVTTTTVVAPWATATLDLCKTGYKGTRQNGQGNRVNTLPEGAVKSQRECCNRCINTPNCVALAWVGPEDEEPSGSGAPSEDDEPETGEEMDKKKKKKPKICQLLIKQTPISPGLAGESLASQRGNGGVSTKTLPGVAGVGKKFDTSTMCPLGVEEYDFGEESEDGVVFRGPCGVPKEV